jgi:hypothetical protein
MYVPFVLFVIAIVLVVIFWELSKINSRLKKTLVPHLMSPINTHDPENRT